MSVGKKLNISFILLIVLLAVSVGSSIFNLKKIENRVEEAMDYRLEQLLLIENIRYGVAMQALQVRAMILEPEAEVHKQELVAIAAEIDEDLITLEEYVSSEEMRSYWEQANTPNNEFNEIMPDIIAAVENGEIEQATAFVNSTVQEVNENMFEAAQAMEDFQKGQMDEIDQEIDTTMITAQIATLSVLGVSILIGIGLIFFVRQSITRPLLHVMNAAEVIGEGDLSGEDIVISSKDELGKLGAIFNDMKNNTRKLIVNIQTNAERVGSSSEQLSASAEEVSVTTEDVTTQVADTAETSQTSARAANESAAAMDETAQGVQRIAEASQMLHSSSNETSEVAQNGTQVILHARQQMDVINGSTTTVNGLVQKLSEQTEEIEKITQVITDITDQTNLLALNAAIESARAGEHGKGFAVVADEVRKLAEESKNSANSIVQLTTEIKNDTENVERAVESSLVSVKDGVEVIERAGESFESIAGAVDGMTSQIQEISATAEQVSASVAEISTGAQTTSGNIDTIAAAMEEQSATMNEVAQVAASLSSTAQELQSESQKFKV